MADFEVFGSADGGDYVVGQSLVEGTQNTLSIAASFSVVSALSVKKTAFASVSSSFAFVSSASLKKSAFASIASSFAFTSSASVSKKTIRPHIRVVNYSQPIRIVA